MTEHISKFIEQQRAANICCVNDDGMPYCFTCFFAVNTEKGILYFKTSPESNHAVIMKKNGHIAGTILPDKMSLLSVKGLQFTGKVLDPENKLSKSASTFYYKKYPFAMAISGELWTIQIDRIKMTDNSKGFGKKLSWDRTETEILKSK